MKGGGGGVGDVECVLHGRVENEGRWRGGGVVAKGRILRRIQHVVLSRSLLHYYPRFPCRNKKGVKCKRSCYKRTFILISWLKNVMYFSHTAFENFRNLKFFQSPGPGRKSPPPMNPGFSSEKNLQNFGNGKTCRQKAC